MLTGAERVTPPLRGTPTLAGSLLGKAILSSRPHQHQHRPHNNAGHRWCSLSVRGVLNVRQRQFTAQEGGSTRPGITRSAATDQVIGMTTESGITLPRFGHIRVGEGKGGGSSRPATQGLELCLPRGLLRAMRGDDNPCCVVGFSAGEGGTPRPRTTSAVWDYSCRPVCGRGATMVGISDGFLGGCSPKTGTSRVGLFKQACVWHGKRPRAAFLTDSWRGVLPRP